MTFEDQLSEYSGHLHATLPAAAAALIEMELRHIHEDCPELSFLDAVDYVQTVVQNARR
ncbi:hypothetical protein [Streptomyces sp. NPDC008001]|uniref:hypothetical protein n=1 Tax=Streptomyces sp. NPDC008001 TaxID=3364804 RepID=UPI0036E96745